MKTLSRREWFATTAGISTFYSASLVPVWGGLARLENDKTDNVEKTAWRPKGPSRCFRQFNLDWSWIALRPGQIAEFFQETSAAQIAALLADSHVDGTVVMAVPHHGYCTHNSRIGERFPSLHYDWFGVMVEELHNRGIAAFGYVTLNWNWKYIRENLGADFIHGQPDEAGVCGNKVMICLNTPGYVDLVEAYTREVLTQYPVDGMRWDILKTARGCSCRGCRMLYEEVFQRPWPENGNLEDREWDAMYDRTIECVVRRLYRVCKELRPEIEVWQNHLNPYFTNPLHLAREMDIAYNEFGDPFRLLVIKGVSGKSAVINGLMNHIPTEPPQPIDRSLWRLVLALGGRCYSYYGHRHTNPRTLLPGEAIQRWHREQLAPFYKVVRDIEPWLKDAQPVTDLAVLFCERTRLRFPQRDRLPYLNAMESWVTYAIRMGRPPLFLDSSDLSDGETLARQWPLLAIPLTSGLTLAELDVLRNYARLGGTVLVMGDALRHDAQGQPLDDFALASEMGVHWQEMLGRPVKLQLTAQMRVSIPRELTEVKDLVRCLPTEGETLIWGNFGGGENLPVFHVRRFGQGRFAWLAVQEPAHVVFNLISYLVGEGPMKIEIPAAQAILTQQKSQNRFVLHLLTDGPVCLRIDRRYVPVSKIEGCYPPSGWEVSLTQSESSIHLTATDGVSDRLVVLQP